MCSVVIQYFCTLCPRLGGFQFPDQRLNPGQRAVKAQSPNHWTARRFPHWALEWTHSFLPRDNPASVPVTDVVWLEHALPPRLLRRPPAQTPAHTPPDTILENSSNPVKFYINPLPGKCQKPTLIILPFFSVKASERKLRSGLTFHALTFCVSPEFCMPS